MSSHNPSQQVGKELAHLFSGYLLSNKPAVEYLNNRGISTDLIEKEMVGFCPAFSKYWFPLMKGRIVVPIYDAHGTLLAFAGRQYAPSANAAKESLKQMYPDPVDCEKRIEMWDRGKWLNEPYPKIRHLYNLNNAIEAIRERNYVIIVEGYFDALVLASNGFPNTVAVCSTTLSERHAILISRYCDNAVILLDGDAAGEMANTKMITTLENENVKPYCLNLPSGFDPDEFLLQFGSKKVRKIINMMLTEDQQLLKLNINERGT